MSILTVQHLEKHFENTKVLNDISFSLEEGQALSIIGSSGSGKTTLLRCLNFLETPDAGTITVQDKVLFDADHHANCSEKEIRKNRLHFGMVFQSFNLFPQYTALENVTLARELMAKDSGESKEAIRATTPTSSPAVSSSGWPSPGHWRSTRIFSALTSQPPRWTRS